MVICENFIGCPFFQKHKDYLDPSDYELLVENYCKGPLMSRCERLRYEKLHGHKASANMLPSGEHLMH